MRNEQAIKPIARSLQKYPLGGHQFGHPLQKFRA
jgi:hypothetical protein